MRDEAGDAHILANMVYSQISEHAAYGGVVPEIAARAHVEILDGLIARALDEAGLGFDELDAVAATAGPGLIGGLMVGLMTAKAICWACSLPLVGVNHLEGHALSPALGGGARPPFLLLLASGGHSQLLIVRGAGRYEKLGTTVDDALGEAFDKAAKLLGLGYPGGPEVARHARGGDASRFDLPRPMKGREGCDFSFSGLKTALRQQAKKLEPLSDIDIADLCASFQQAAIEAVIDRAGRAMDEYERRMGENAPRVMVAAGGVAANACLREELGKLAARRGFAVEFPPPELCSDNGAMIAWAGIERLRLGHVDGMELAARARWPLDEENSLPGAKA
jgi:N6-L-threonylcarbamoyladenine synthase